jgi:hypothetical protein
MSQSTANLCKCDLSSLTHIPQELAPQILASHDPRPSSSTPDRRCHQHQMRHCLTRCDGNSTRNRSKTVIVAASSTTRTRNAGQRIADAKIMRPAKVPGRTVTARDSPSCGHLHQHQSDRCRPRLSQADRAETPTDSIAFQKQPLRREQTEWAKGDDAIGVKFTRAWGYMRVVRSSANWRAAFWLSRDMGMIWA